MEAVEVEPEVTSFVPCIRHLDFLMWTRQTYKSKEFRERSLLRSSGVNPIRQTLDVVVGHEGT